MHTHTQKHIQTEKTHLMNNKQKYLNTITRNLRDNAADFKNWNGLMRLGTMQKNSNFKAKCNGVLPIRILHTYITFT